MYKNYKVFEHHTGPKLNEKFLSEGKEMLWTETVEIGGKNASRKLLDFEKISPATYLSLKLAGNLVKRITFSLGTRIGVNKWEVRVERRSEKKIPNRKTLRKTINTI